MKKLVITLITAGLLALGTATIWAQANQPEKAKKKAGTAQQMGVMPNSVIHVVTVAWKPGTTDQQIKAALDGVRALPSRFPGITRVWTRHIKVQNPRGTETPRTHAFVMEFANEQALKDYHDSAAQKEWYNVYIPIRAESSTHDITN